MKFTDFTPSQVYVVVAENDGHCKPIAAYMMEHKAIAALADHEERRVIGPIPLIGGFDGPKTPNHPFKPVIDPDIDIRIKPPMKPKDGFPNSKFDRAWEDDRLYDNGDGLFD